MGRTDYIELLELQTLIKESVAEAFPGRFWVKAEITSWSPRSTGHCYLTLSQSRSGKSIAESRAMIWKWNYPRLSQYFYSATGQQLQAGITVLVKVQVSYSELYGMSLFIEDIDPAFTLGAAALERKRAIARLEKEGFMEMQKELALPEIPCRLAIISSRTAAGYQDFCNHLVNNPEGYAFRLDLFEALMQGEKAPDSIMDALEKAREGGYDAILILRGGGSEQDLSCFDSYDLAVAIATSEVPVVTAIGHDKDVHIADMVANTAVKTPTALADLFLDALRAQDEILDRIHNRISQSIRKRMGDMQQRVDGLHSRIRLALSRRYSAREQGQERLAARIRLALSRRVSAEQQRQGSAAARIRIGLNRKLSERENLLQRAVTRISRGLGGKYMQVSRQADVQAHRVKFAGAARVSQEVSALALKESRIKSTDPRNILSLGYVLVTGKDNKVLKTVDRVGVGDRIGVRFSDGSLTAKVDEVYSDKIDNNKTQIA